MKRGMEEFNLRNAFAQEPERCHQALMNAARSVREDEPVKKYTLSTVLIAAVLIIAMMAAALAATGGGLTNWFKRYYHTDVPKAAQDILSSTEKSVLEAGPVVFTVNELLCDGKIAYLTVQARLKEEGGALLYPASGDCFERIGEMTAQKLNHPDVNAQSTYLEAAQRTGLPLWCTDAWLEVDNYNLVDFEMCDGTVLEDGSLLMVRMLYFNEPYAADTLPVEVMVQADELELETLEYMEGSRERAAEKRSIAIHGVTEERTYSPQEEAKLADGDSLTRVVAENQRGRVCVPVFAGGKAPYAAGAAFPSGRISCAG